ncbi:MAG TPA: hypothetical protein VM425_19370 [Myxococcota bacterium]|nr:hypothetical protein [Myxococcota bacterium]
MIIARMKRLLVSAPAVVLLLSVLTHCELPPGCGPGDIPSNPLSSNLIEYTKPASGAILFQEDFAELKVKLLRPIDKGTFSVADDVRLFEISNFWYADRDEVPYPGSAGVVFSQAPWACPGASCDQIDLVVNSSALDPLRHYRIRILGAEASDPANPGDRPATL